ncbi:MAG: PP2C family protein-serine/threonine phosphatase [Candidatus Sulfotelmatobacter sp.]|jgi:sigma-B regulation protein RsbU (phosphoserine phosphatase)
MYAPVPELTADQVLQAFRHDAPSLLFGAIIMAVGVVAAAFSVLRRKYDRLLIYLGLLAVLYGLRMWMQSQLLFLTMQEWPFYARVASAIDFVVPIPAILFLDAAGFLHRKMRSGTYVIEGILALLALGTLAVGRQNIFYTINAVLIIAALTTLVLISMGRRSADRDAVVIRRGLLIFAAFIFWENFRSILGIRLPDIEPIGFVAFLAALGYVAARQTLQRDLQLREIQKELEVARRIQLSILPGEFPNFTNFRVAARYVPMTSVAGDFYDFIVADDNRAGLLIADVSGHGVPAALIASMVKLAATSQRANAGDPARLLAGMNAALCGNTQNQFVTAAYVHLDSIAGTLRYSAAGHPPMLLLRRGEVIEISENGLILAAFDYATYTNGTRQLEPGDRFLLYTDGIVEAANAAGDFFGQDALAAVLRQTAELAPAVASDQIVSAVQRWSASQDDDLTVLICDYVARKQESPGTGSGEPMQ